MYEYTKTTRRKPHADNTLTNDSLVFKDTFLIVILP